MTQSVASDSIALWGLEGRVYDPAMTIKYIQPSRVITYGGTVTGAENLLIPGASQVSLATTTDICKLSTRGNTPSWILLDFGKELHGGVRLSSMTRATSRPVKVRLCFGESVAEALSSIGNDNAGNDHAMRDYIIDVPWVGSIEVGNTGYRFIKVELAEPNADLNLLKVEGILKYRDIPYLGSFTSDDPRLNEIWKTGAYTVHLNMQDYLWDGIKRDRLVWIGDMHPEVMTVNAVFGNNDIVKKSLDFVRDQTPLPGWMNDMCSYSLWWIITQRDYCLYTGDLNYLKQQESYLDILTDQIISNCDGQRENLRGGRRFLDWPTSEMPDVIHAGLQALTIIALDAANQIAIWLDNSELSAKSSNASKTLREYLPQDYGNKQASALLALAGMGSLDMFARKIAKDGAEGYSTFFGYYMLEALAKAGMYQNALEVISDYWGGMLDLGATTFWEDVSLDDLKSSSRIDEIPTTGKYNFHTQGGRYCYSQLRNSLCHGWASGPTAWLSRHVLGIEPVEPGFKKVRINPHLGLLKEVEGSMPTPYGLITVKHKKRSDGTISSDIVLPKGVKRIH